MTEADKVINQQHLGSDPVDIRIQIQINVEIQIWIPDHFCSRLDTLGEVCNLSTQSRSYVSLMLYTSVTYL